MKNAYEKEIYRSQSCRILLTELGTFEVMHNLNLKGLEVMPKDEDFGVWAWSVRTEERARMIAGEIETGKRPIVAMEAQV